MGIFNRNTSSKKFNTSLPIQTGWTPLLAWEEYPADSGLYIAKITDWTGGVNNPPTITNVYLGNGTTVSSQADAVQFGILGSYTDTLAKDAVVRDMIDSDTGGSGDTDMLWSANKLFTDFATTNGNVTTNATNIGTLSSLTTVDKANLVAAVNEVELNFNNHEASSVKHGLVADTGWTTITTGFATNWTGTLSYKKDVIGQAHVIFTMVYTGSLPATTATTIYTLPAGYFPAIQKVNFIGVDEDAADVILGNIVISTVGVIGFNPDGTYTSGRPIYGGEIIYTTV